MSQSKLLHVNDGGIQEISANNVNLLLLLQSPKPQFWHIFQLAAPHQNVLCIAGFVCRSRYIHRDVYRYVCT